MTPTIMPIIINSGRGSISKEGQGSLIAVLVLLTAIGLILLVAHYLINVRSRKGYFGLEVAAFLINAICWLLWAIIGLMASGDFLNSHLFHF